MKSIAALLVIANLVFFAWQYPQQKFNLILSNLSIADRDTKNDDEEASQSVLMMLKELPRLVAEKVVTVDLEQEQEQVPVQGQDKGPVPPSAKTDKTKRVTNCWTLSPFGTGKAADDGLSILTSRSIKGRTVEQKQQGITGYRVLLPSEASRALARSQSNKLKAKGIKDIAVLAVQNRFAVALGFFSRKSSAELRAREILALGYEPVIEEVTGEKSLYAIEVYTIDDPSEWEAVWMKLRDSYPKIERKPRKCT